MFAAKFSCEDHIAEACTWATCYHSKWLHGLVSSGSQISGAKLSGSIFLLDLSKRPSDRYGL